MAANHSAGLAAVVGVWVGVPSRLSEHARWYFWVYVLVHLLRRESCGWGGWSSTHQEVVGAWSSVRGLAPLAVTGAVLVRPWASEFTAFQRGVL